MTTAVPIPCLATLPRPVFARKDSWPSGSWTEPHRHDWIQFTYAARGVLQVRTSCGNHLSPPQRAIWIPPDMLHSLSAHSTVALRTLYIATNYISAHMKCWIPLTTIRVVEMSPLVRELLRTFSRRPVCYDEHGADGRLVGVLLDELLTLPEAGLSLPLPNDPRLITLCENMLDNPDRKSVV